jgi:hypothetical protein
MATYIIIILAGLITIIAFAQNSPDHSYTVPEPAPGQYRFFHEKNGVTVYLSWVVMNGKTLAVKFKVINKNNYPVTVTWTGPQWYSKGIYLTTTYHPGESTADENSYSNQFAMGKDNDSGQYDINASKIYPSEPNYLYFDAPKGEWNHGQLTVTFANFLVVPQNEAIAIA